KQVLKLGTTTWHIRADYDQPSRLCRSTFQFPWSMHSVRKGIGFNSTFQFPWSMHSVRKGIGFNSTFQFPWSMHSVRRGIGFNLSITYNLADFQRWFVFESTSQPYKARSRPV